jgi:hypothetical protein
LSDVHLVDRIGLTVTVRRSATGASSVVRAVSGASDRHLSARGSR